MKYILFLLFGNFIASISQVMLKKAADRSWPSPIREYLNPLVIGAYMLFGLSTVMNILGYRQVDLGLAAVLEATAYIYVTFFGIVLFHERLNRKKILALVLILAGIMLSALS